MYYTIGQSLKLNSDIKSEIEVLIIIPELVAAICNYLLKLPYLVDIFSKKY